MSNPPLFINGRIAIPDSELTMRFVQSSGPGGQHVNKSATKVLLSFDVANSPALLAQLTADEHQRLLARLRPRLDSSGVLQIAVQESRSQLQNRQIALDRLAEILQEALKKPKPRKKTRPSRAARESRLESKKQRGQIKKERGWKWKG